MAISQVFKFTFRLIHRNLTMSLVLILTLALGIGANSAIFSIVSSVLLRPLPYPEPEGLVAVWEAERGGRSDIPVADGNFPDLRAQSRTLAGLAAYGNDKTLVTAGTASLLIPVSAVSRDFFPLFRAKPVLGRTLSSDEFGEGTPAVAVLSHALWRSAFGGDPGVLGRELIIYGDKHTIIGVLAEGFEFPRGAALWVDYERYIGESRTAHNLQLVGRLAPGKTVEGAQNEMSLIARRLAASYPGDLPANFDIAVRSLHQDLIGNAGATLLLLQTTTVTILLIACGNIAGILLSLTISRRRELAIRQAVGADTFRLVSQLIVETITLGLIGSLVGLFLASQSISLLSSLVPQTLLHSGAIRLDQRVVGFSLLLGLITGLLCGLIPVWRILRQAPLKGLRTSGSEVELGERPRRLGGLFVVPQYAFSLAALTVAGLLVKSLITLVSVDPGFKTQGLITAEIHLPTSPPSRYAERPVLVSFYQQLVDGVGALPNVEAVTLAHSLPFGEVRINGVALREGDPMSVADEAGFYPDYRVVGKSYFRTMGITLLRGRDFGPEDTQESLPVAIVNQTLARQMWGEGNPLGKSIILPGLDFNRDEAKRTLTVVGVASGVRQERLDLPPNPAVYVPYFQHLTRARTLNLVAAVGGRSDRYLEPIRDLIHKQDPGLPEGRIQTIEGWVRESTSEPRFRAGVVTAFAVLALLLAVLGIYGVLSYAFSQRRRELVIRMAVGARRLDLWRLVFGEGVRFILAGQLLGTAATLALSRLLEGLLFGVKTADATVFSLASVSLATVVLLTCLIPAQKVGRLDPMAVLRED